MSCVKTNYMRIAFITPEYVTPTNADGGLANYLQKTAMALTQRGCEVWVFLVSTRDAIWRDNDVVVCEVQCDNIISNITSRIPILRIFVSMYSKFVSTRKIARKFWHVHSTNPFDIIQASSYMAPGFALLNNGKVPVVCRASSYSSCWRDAFGRKRNMGESISDWMELKQVRDADAAFAPSHFVANMYELADGGKPFVLRTPVDMENHGLNSSFFLENRPVGRYLLFFGTLSRIKGVDLFDRILPRIFEKYIDLSMVFIGRDDGLPDGTKIFSHIKSGIHNYAERLYYHQALNKTNLYPFIEHAEAVLIPSRVDNYPNACLEAQMFGIPVIGTYDSSLDEMIIDGITGFLARNGEAESITTEIERCLDQSRAEREQLRQRILAQIKLIVDEDRIGQLLTFYEDTVKSFVKKHE